MKISKLVIIAIILAAVSASIVIGEPTEKKDASSEPFKWNKYDEALTLAAKQNKPLMVDFYTDWCGFCKKLDKNTYADPTVAEYIKGHFIAVKVNAESKEPFNLPTGQMTGSSLAKSFGVTGYPAVWFLKPNGERINYYPGYAPPEKFILVLKYIGDGIYKTQSWKDYSAKYGDK
jgi:thioredoxin-related protein